MPQGVSCFEDVPLVEFVYLVFTRMPGGVTVGDSGLCVCVCVCVCVLSVDRYYFPLFGDLDSTDILHMKFLADFAFNKQQTGKGTVILLTKQNKKKRQQRNNCLSMYGLSKSQ